MGRARGLLLVFGRARGLLPVLRRARGVLLVLGRARGLHPRFNHAISVSMRRGASSAYNARFDPTSNLTTGFPAARRRQRDQRWHRPQQLRRLRILRVLRRIPSDLRPDRHAQHEPERSDRRVGITVLWPFGHVIGSLRHRPRSRSALHGVCRGKTYVEYLNRLSPRLLERPPGVTHEADSTTFCQDWRETD